MNGQSQGATWTLFHLSHEDASGGGAALVELNGGATIRIAGGGDHWSVSARYPQAASQLVIGTYHSKDEADQGLKRLAKLVGAVDLETMEPVDLAA